MSGDQLTSYVCVGGPKDGFRSVIPGRPAAIEMLDGSGSIHRYAIIEDYLRDGRTVYRFDRSIPLATPEGS
jgi:hypothetical protein